LDPALTKDTAPECFSMTAPSTTDTPGGRASRARRMPSLLASGLKTAVGRWSTTSRCEW
jgi:hypothetical protein